MQRKRIIASAAIGVALLGGMTACKKDADVVNKNIATDADNFKILRRTVFINGITDNVMMSVEGFCSIETDNPNRWAVTCKVGNEYKRNYMGKADNVTMISEQIGTAGVSASHYKFVFKPSTIIPEPEIR